MLSGGNSTLEIAFESISLRSFCETEAHAIREFGKSVAELLKHRLADMRVATSIKDLIVGRPRELTGANSGQIMLELCDGHCVVFCANHTNNPTTSIGAIDWPKVRRIRILYIGDNYDL